MSSKLGRSAGTRFQHSSISLFASSVNASGIGAFFPRGKSNILILGNSPPLRMKKRRRHELRASSERHCLFLDAHQLLDAEVADFDDAVSVNENVGRLQVTVDDSFAVDVPHSIGDLVDDECEILVTETTSRDEIIKARSTVLKHDTRRTFVLLVKNPNALMMFGWSLY
ncbi:hypothetical protein M9Y10_023613 [Tritrichomonas musculus]|uniref:Uncharacterized protein n=1 Tax=Tritrichomonas musculus TaxID=1915356 RepID=A0ABR2KWP6_9EUKA